MHARGFPEAMQEPLLLFYICHVLEYFYLWRRNIPWLSKGLVGVGSGLRRRRPVGRFATPRRR
jgi:hypothetical protein